jgi:carbon-monoxide dehydrogenase small subunit
VAAGGQAKAKPRCHNEGQVREALEGNICRCTGYHNIVKAVIKGAADMKATA